MIFFFAGGPKHGSHFQLYIIIESLKMKGINYEQAGINIIDRNDFTGSKRVLDNLTQKNDQYFICKGHFHHKNLLFSYPDMRIFLIWREIGDVLVSRYQYLMRRYNRIFDDFADYYKQEGRKHMFYQRYYQLLWKAEEDPRVCHVSYTNLRKDFHNAVKPMLEFAGLLGVDVDVLEEKVSLERSRKKHNDPEGILIRKGTIGEYKSVIPSEILADMEKISKMSPLQLKVEALLNDPRVLLAQYYDYPGKSIVKRIALTRYNNRKKKKEMAKERDVVWWD